MAFKETNLKTSMVKLDDLWRLVDRTRSTSKTVTLDKAALTGLLIDHGRMAGELFSIKKIRES